MAPLPLITLILLQALVCHGFDFSLSFESLVAGGTSSPSVCAVLQCIETLNDDQLDSRKVTALTIYRRIASDGAPWKQLAKVSTAIPRDNRVSDGRRITGDLTEKQANLTLGLLKAADCAEAEFSCVAILTDANGKNTVMKSYVGGQTPPDQGSGVDDIGQNIARDHKPLSVTAEQSSEIREVKMMISSLMDKLNCIEKRFEDSAKHDDKLEEKLETLKSGVTDKLHYLESNVRSQLESSTNRLEDRLERLENRLEDKVSQIFVRQPSDRDNEQFQNKAEHKLDLILDAVVSTNTSIHYIQDKTHSTATNFPSKSAGVNTFDNNTQLVSSIDSLSAITHDLVTSVQALSPVCSNRAPESVEEFFDVLGTGKKEWRLAFRGTAYNNVKIYPAYMHGTGIPAEVEPGCKHFNYSVPCVNHYRNKDAFDNWNNIDEVLLAVFDKGQMVKRIVFNGHGSTITSWFEASRVILSSWDDMKTQSQNFFSIEGETRPQYMRRFFINHDYTTCETFKGWFFVGEALDGGCATEKTIARPFIQFAAGKTMAVWQSSGVARADSFGVFLKYD
ncbi:hypothetical protein EGW08_016282 [Elysia chlorotica]|uniref:Fibrinogen C-terminal domain-containing protein n=1 Tax=Elysia chlorotica TaxID=188477 RepID=A0A433T325_ELYCH|nr:hypothetical protein EGW08_016282 [Elysia chlorotica]